MPLSDTQRASRRHAPRGPIKAKSDPIEPSDPIDARSRCVATNRRGTRCGKSPIPGGTVCRMHGGAAPQVRAKAQERLKALLPKAITTLDGLMDRVEFPSVQYQASKAVIEFSEGKATERVESNVDAVLEIRWQG